MHLGVQRGDGGGHVGIGRVGGCEMDLPRVPRDVGRAAGGEERGGEEREGKLIVAWPWCQHPRSETRRRRGARGPWRGPARGLGLLLSARGRRLARDGEADLRPTLSHHSGTSFLELNSSQKTLRQERLWLIGIRGALSPSSLSLRAVASGEFLEGWWGGSVPWRNVFSTEETARHTGAVCQEGWWGSLGGPE